MEEPDPMAGAASSTVVRSDPRIDGGLGAQLWLLHALIYAWAWRLALTHLPLRSTRRRLQRLAGFFALPAGPHTLARARHAVDRASPYLRGGGNCFVRALTLHTLLAHRGIRAEIRVGFVTTTTGAKEGHAWVEHEERILIGEIAGLEAFRQCSERY